LKLENKTDELNYIKKSWCLLVCLFSRDLAFIISVSQSYYDYLSFIFGLEID